MKKLIWLVPVICFGILFATWKIGDNDPVSSAHAFSFLQKQDPWFIYLAVVLIAYLLIAVLGTFLQWNVTTESKWFHIIYIVGTFAIAFIFGTTRNNAGHDVNVSARYNAYAESKGWTDTYPHKHQPPKADTTIQDGDTLIHTQ